MVGNNTVPNADVCLNLQKKFAVRTRPRILTKYGGSQSRSILSYVLFRLSDVQQEPTFAA